MAQPNRVTRLLGGPKEHEEGKKALMYGIFSLLPMVLQIGLGMVLA